MSRIDDLRRRARKLDLRVVKSRANMVHSNNHGGFMLVGAATNTLIDGSNYDLSLEDLEQQIAAAEGAA